MNKDEFKNALHAQNVTVTDEQIEQFEKYMNLLDEWNHKMNLTAIKDPEEVWEKHFYDSLRPFLHEEFKSLADIGSGAGFPGIPLAILYPERQFTLVEPLSKRCRFLDEVVRQLNLKNVTVINERAEDFAKNHREAFDTISARAVARLSILLELCMPLLKTGGEFIAMKGRNGRQELKEAAPALRELSVSLKKEEEYSLSADDQRINFYLIKDRKTPAKYPRPYSMIKKKPLENHHE